MKYTKYIKQTSIVCAATALLTTQAFASGYMIPEQGAKATGMSNAYAAIADDASANWFNPAGLSFQENNITGSAALVYPLNEYKDSNGQAYSAVKGIHVVPQVYMRYGSDDSKISYGLGINSPFGLSVDWTGSGAPFSELAAGADSVTFSEIQAVHINPNIAYQISDNFSIALGIQYYNAFKVHLDGQSLKIGGSGDGFGGNFALMYKSGNWSIGGSYRSKVKLDITGTAVGGPGLALVGLEGIGANANTSVTFPDLHTLAIAYQATSDLLLSAQVDRTNWATFDQIVINYDPSTLQIATGSSSTIPEGWKATVAFRLGAEWTLGGSTSIRMGYTYDPTPTNAEHFSPRLPGNDRQLASLGYGQKISENLSMDLAYMYVWLADRNATNPTKTLYQGTYTGSVHLLSGGITYKF